MVNLAIMAIVVALMFLASACFIMLRPKTAAVFVVCGLVIFGCGVVRDTLDPPEGMATVLLR
ncbi:hypothetical protein GCM10007874_45250 [Labrys miyagiensis]|uniref:Uncharacterized protein n=1 Tax=Labrys miyagiensis TaxID=346912 RepID=A0ABQ6CMH4_9HYPH|nr:hypothetical protein [Labrys miyagiensis]GLS21508.1 hypothetical protein GCM10007874_45250 [Labrys miyagiensis]